MLSSYVGEKFSYGEATIFFCQEPLNLRKQTLVETFIKRTVKSDKYNYLFHIDRPLPNSRVFKEFRSYKDRHFRSPLVALTRASNKMSWG